MLNEETLMFVCALDVSPMDLLSAAEVFVALDNWTLCP